MKTNSMPMPATLATKAMRAYPHARVVAYYAAQQRGHHVIHRDGRQQFHPALLKYAKQQEESGLYNRGDHKCHWIDQQFFVIGDMGFTKKSHEVER